MFLESFEKNQNNKHNSSKKKHTTKLVGSRALPPSQTKISYTQAKSQEQIINKFPPYFLATIDTFFPAMSMDALLQGY